MLHQYQYISEKLREAEAVRRRAAPSLRVDAQPARDRGGRRGPIGPIARVAGRHVRRVGEALESWATPQAAAR